MAIYPAFYTRGAFIGGPTSNGTSGQTLITAGDGTSSWTNTLTAAATNTSALIAKALAGQSAVTFKVVSSDDSVHFSAGGTSVISNVNVDFASKLTVTPASVGQVVVTVTGLTSQTATLLQLNHGATPGASANYLSCTSSGGSEGNVLAVLSNGKVGIGIAAPAAMLHVANAVAPAIKITDTDVGVGLTDGLDIQMSGTNAYIWNYENGGLSLATNNVERVFITSGGLVGINKTSSVGAMLHVVASAATAIGQITDGAASQSANLHEWRSSAAAVYGTVSENGYFTTRKIAAPADAELATSELAFWFDSTAGAAKLKIKAKNASGTVVNGEVALA